MVKLANIQHEDDPMHREVMAGARGGDSASRNGKYTTRQRGQCLPQRGVNDERGPSRHEELDQKKSAKTAETMPTYKSHRYGRWRKKRDSEEVRTCQLRRQADRPSTPVKLVGRQCECGGAVAPARSLLVDKADSVGTKDNTAHDECALRHDKDSYGGATKRPFVLPILRLSLHGAPLTGECAQAATTAARHRRITS